MSALVLLLIGLLFPPSLARHADPGLHAQVTTGFWLFKVVALLGAGYLAVGARRLWWANPDTLAPPRRWSHTMVGATLGLIGAAAAVRLYGLGEGMWTDEVSTLVHFVRPSTDRILTTYDSQNQHMLFSLLAHGAIVVLGESVWSLRLPAALFGIATIWAIVVLAREVSDDREALLSGLVLTFSYHHIWFSQNARGYSGVLFFSLVSSVCFLRAHQAHRPRMWAWYALCVGLGMYTHLTMVFVVLAQFLFYVWTTVRRRGRFSPSLGPLWAGFIPASLLTLLLYAPVVPQILGATTTDVSDVATWRSVSWMFIEIVRGFGLNSATLAVIVAVGLAVVGPGVWSYGQRQPFIPWMLVLSVALGGILMAALQHHLWPRFFFYAAGFGVLVVVRAQTTIASMLTTLLRRSHSFQTRLATVLTIAMIVVLGRSLAGVYLPKQDYAGARDFIHGARQPGDAIVATGVAASPYRLYYAPAWTEVTTLADLRAVQDTSQRVWLVYTLPIQLRDNQPELLHAVESEFELVRAFDGSLGGGDIYVYRSIVVHGPSRSSSNDTQE